MSIYKEEYMRDPKQIQDDMCVLDLIRHRVENCSCGLNSVVVKYEDGMEIEYFMDDNGMIGEVQVDE